MTDQHESSARHDFDRAAAKLMAEMSDTFETLARTRELAINFARSKMNGTNPSADENDIKQLANDLAARTAEQWGVVAMALALDVDFWIGPRNSHGSKVGGEVTIQRHDANLAPPSLANGFRVRMPEFLLSFDVKEPQAVRIACQSNEEIERKAQETETWARFREVTCKHFAYHWPNVYHEWQTINAARAEAARESHEENQRVARAFAEEHSQGLQPSPTELAGLAMALVERSREEVEPISFLIGRPAVPPPGLHRTKRPEEIEKEVTRNQILRAVTREIETLRERRECAPDLTPEDRVDLLKKEDAACVRQAFAYYWPEVFEAWKLDRRPTTLARFPAVLAVGPGALAPFFGHTVTGKTQRQKGSGRVEHLIVRNRGAQLSLRLPGGVVELPANPSSDQVLAAIASVTGNREFRFFGSILVATNDDARSGLTTEGGFFYRPARFAELLGFSDDESTEMLDDCLEALMCVSLTATLKVGGKELKVTAESLVIDGGGTIEARDTGKPGRRRGGRPRARLYRLQDFVLQLIGEGAAWFPLSKKALAPPDGVDQRKWDDAFKIYGVLGSLARLNKPRGNVWRNKVAMILETANITKKQARPSERMGRLKELCGYLCDAGLITFNLQDEWLEFDLPPLRPALEAVHAKRKTAKSLARPQSEGA